MESDAEMGSAPERKEVAWISSNRSRVPCPTTKLTSTRESTTSDPD